MSSPQTTTPTADLSAVAEAIRGHDRFLVTTHENPDGDALGSLLASRLALDQLGKDAVMYLGGEAPLPAEYAIIGKVIKGQDVAEKIGALEIQKNQTDGPPVLTVYTEKVTIKVS